MTNNIPIMLPGVFSENMESRGVDHIISVMKNLWENLTAKNLLILKAPTGSGKSVGLLPELVRQNVDCNIKCTLPKISNVDSIFNSIPELWSDFQSGVNIGKRSSKSTIVTNQLTGTLNIMTTEILNREVGNWMSDLDSQTQQGKNILVIDEVHELSIEMFNMLNNINCLLRDPDTSSGFFVILMSATLDENILADIFDVKVQPHTLFMKLSDLTKPKYEIIPIGDELLNMDMLQYTVDIITRDEHSGKNILIFLPGKQSIDEFVNTIVEKLPDNVYV